MPKVLIKRGTRAQIDAAAAASGLAAGEPYLITDEGRPAVGLTVSTYAAGLKQGESLALTAGYSEGRNAIASAGSAQTITLDGRVWDITLTATTCTLSVSVPSGATVAQAVVLLRQDATGGRAVSWPGTARALGTQTLASGAGEISVWILWTPDAGTTLLLSPAGTE